MDLQKIAVGAGGLLLIWWGVHIYEAPAGVVRASNTCDPIYALGRYANTEIASGFTAESDSVRVENRFAWIGRYCFCGAAKLQKVIGWQTSCDAAQRFNPNDFMYAKVLNNNKELNNLPFFENKDDTTNDDSKKDNTASNDGDLLK